MIATTLGLGRQVQTASEDRAPQKLRLVYLALPGPGGGGGGGGLKAPAPPPKAQRKGRQALSSPLPVRQPPPRPQPRPEPPLPEVKPEPLPPVQAPVVTAPADTRDRPGVLEETPPRPDSRGQGTDGGVGTGAGTGVGEGQGSGIGEGFGGGTGGGPFRPAAGHAPLAASRGQARLYRGGPFPRGGGRRGDGDRRPTRWLGRRSPAAAGTRSWPRCPCDGGGARLAHSRPANDAAFRWTCWSKWRWNSRSGEVMMDNALVVITLGSLATTGAVLLYAARMIRDERARSSARVTALAEEIGGSPGAGRRGDANRAAAARSGALARGITPERVLHRQHVPVLHPSAVNRNCGGPRPAAMHWQTRPSFRRGSTVRGGDRTGERAARNAVRVGVSGVAVESLAGARDRRDDRGACAGDDLFRQRSAWTARTTGPGDGCGQRAVGAGVLAPGAQG